MSVANSPARQGVSAVVTSLAKNTLVLLLAQVASMLFGVLYTMYMGQYLGAEGFGVLGTAMAITGIAVIIVDLGMNVLITREVARDISLAKKYVGNIMLIKLVLVALTFGLLAVVVNVGGYSPLAQEIVYIMAISAFITSYYNVFFGLFRAYEKMEYQSLATIINSALTLAGILLAIRLDLGIAGVAYAYLLANLVTLALCLIISALFFVMPGVEFDPAFWKEAIKSATPFAVTLFCTGAYMQVNIIMLDSMKGAEAVGWYNAAFKLVSFILFIPVIFNSSIFPVMSRYYVSSKDSLRISFEKFFKYMAFIGLPLGLGITFVAGKVIFQVYGDEFINSIIVLQVLIWSIVLIFIRSPFERLLEASNRQASLTKIFIIATVMNVLLNYVLIPLYSYVGAAAAMVLTDAVILLAVAYVTRKVGFSIDLKIFRDIGKMAIPCLAMCVSIYLLASLNVIIVILISMLVYALTSLLVNIFDSDEIIIIKSIYDKFNKQYITNVR